MLKGVDRRREPERVQLLRDALSERLGRPAASRAVKGSYGHWFISDPCFAVLQRGSGAEQRGYRSGLYVAKSDIYFCNVHSRGPAQLLRTNLMARPEALAIAASATRRLRSTHYLAWSSRAEAKKRPHQSCIKKVETTSWKEFEAQIAGDAARDIVADLFPRLPSSGSGKRPAVRGSNFELLLEDTKSMSNVSTAIAARRAEQIIDAAWHLFCCMYPWEPMPQRAADLRRAMSRHIVGPSCEYHRIKRAPFLDCDRSNRVEAAHIRPYAQGGSDRPWNGMWLCPKHHRVTEGRLSGTRDRTDLTRVRVYYLG